MPTMEEIKLQITRLDGLERFFGRKEIKELPTILWENEVVKDIVQGYYNNGQGVLVATDRRLIFIDKGIFVGLKVEDFPYDRISSIQYKTGFLMGEITIFASGNEAEIAHVDKAKTRSFSEGVRARISNTEPASSGPSTDGGDTISKLERLAKLHAQGILNADEFYREKRKILES